MNRTGSVVVAACLVLAGAASAAAQSPSVAPGAKPIDRSDLRRQIYVMEGALMRAVAFGAQGLNREIRSVAPEMVVLSGEPQARGVYLEGYGVFFDVGVPILHQSMVWSLRTMLGQDPAGAAEALNVIRQMAKQVDVAQRLPLENAIARLELSVGAAVEPQAPLFSQVRPGGAGGTPVNDRSVTGAMVTAPAAQVPVPPQPTVTGAAASKAFSLDRRSLQDPNAVNRAYTEFVQRELIEAIIDLPMTLAPNEFLTVGARDNMQRDSLAPFDPSQEVVTILLKLKGSDLAEYRAGRLDRDEVRRRVQVGEF